jgi:hypothetical protein
MPRVGPEEHRRLGVELFNRVWELLERPHRTAAEVDEMIHAAHASRYHWSHAGTTVNLARGEWQCSRVYAVLGRAEPALWHAQRSLELTEAAPEAEDWDLPFAYEALARAHGQAGEPEDAARYRRLAHETGESIADAEDRELLLAALASLP